MLALLGILAYIAVRFQFSFALGAVVATIHDLLVTLAFLAFFALIAEAGPGKATIITYVNPVVAVTLGVILLDESVGPSAVAGLLLILAGSWLSTGGKLPPGLTARRRGVAAAAIARE